MIRFKVLIFAVLALLVVGATGWAFSRGTYERGYDDFRTSPIASSSPKYGYGGADPDSGTLPVLDGDTPDPDRTRRPNYDPPPPPPVGEEPRASDGCYAGGCSGQICSSEPDAFSTCEWREEYGCYGPNARCERQPDGQCGWTQTPELMSCLANARRY